MSSTADDSRIGELETDERYLHRGSDAVPEHFSSRSVTRQAGFLLPYLRAGMHLLDCGCGPGTITLGLAEVVDPGQVVGIDLDEVQIELAQEAALQQRQTNVHFEAASVYGLPFPNASFDAIVSNGLLSYLRDPLVALQEMRRVLRPDGVIGIRNPDAGGQLISPDDPLLMESFALYWQLIERNGGNRTVGRRQRALLHRAGFTKIWAGASCENCGTVEETRHWGGVVAAVLQEDQYAVPLLESGVTDRASLNQMSKAWREWGDKPDAFYCEIWCEAVGKRA